MPDAGADGLVPVRAVGVVAALSLIALLVAIIVGFTVVVIAELVVVVCALMLLPVVLITLAVAESVVLILGIVGMLGLRVVVVLSLVLCSRGGWWQGEQRRGQKTGCRNSGECKLHYFLLARNVGILSRVA